MRDLTEEELFVVNLLGTAFNAFMALPKIHSADAPEYAQAIHKAQNIVLSRPAAEQTLARDDE